MSNAAERRAEPEGRMSTLRERATARGAATGAAGGLARGATEFALQGSAHELSGGAVGGGWDYRNLTSGNVTGSVSGAQGGMADRTNALAESTVAHQEPEHSTPRNNVSHGREVLENGHQWPVGARPSEGWRDPYTSGAREQFGISAGTAIGQAGRSRPQDQDDEPPLPTPDR
ncbi:hypothetical protein [Actinoalloteichus caeruleus]|uniref:hypothetical protein n=1 Tax=Actinoalloteichus cyanogriseus TaxID=2893586 RepID=UPI0004AB2783|nr:hypothetical protein [Actinoalloteichus caeruleus]